MFGGMKSSKRKRGSSFSHPRTKRAKPDFSGDSSKPRKGILKKGTPGTRSKQDKKRTQQRKPGVHFRTQPSFGKGRTVTKKSAGKVFRRKAKAG